MLNLGQFNLTLAGCKRFDFVQSYVIKALENLHFLFLGGNSLSILEISWVLVVSLLFWMGPDRFCEGDELGLGWYSWKDHD